MTCRSCSGSTVTLSPPPSPSFPLWPRTGTLRSENGSEESVECRGQATGPAPSVTSPVTRAPSLIMASKSSFLDKVLGRLGRLDAEGLQTVVQRLARERSFLETLFNTIEDGVLVVDERGRILYFNQAVVRLLGLSAEGVEGQHITRYLPE